MSLVFIVIIRWDPGGAAGGPLKEPGCDGKPLLLPLFDEAGAPDWYDENN